MNVLRTARFEPTQRSHGFTLIELMIVVSIVGLLASLAIPQYEMMILRAKRAEVRMNLEGIRVVENGYHAEWDVYTSCAQSPASLPGRRAVPFGATIATHLDWNQLGWVPDGKVYAQYSVTANDQVGELATFSVDGYTDIDGDGNAAHYQGTETYKPVMMTPNVVY